jgi:hypothetical protein
MRLIKKIKRNCTDPKFIAQKYGLRKFPIYKGASEYDRLKINISNGSSVSTHGVIVDWPADTGNSDSLK